MHDFYEENLHWLLFGCVIVVAVVWGLFGSGFSDNGSRADEIREQLESAGNNQQQITTEAKQLREEIGSIREEIVELAEDQRTAGEIIKDCQRTINQVRARKQ